MHEVKKCFFFSAKPIVKEEPFPDSDENDSDNCFLADACEFLSNVYSEIRKNQLQTRAKKLKYK